MGYPQSICKKRSALRYCGHNESNGIVKEEKEHCVPRFIFSQCVKGTKYAIAAFHVSHFGRIVLYHFCRLHRWPKSVEFKITVAVVKCRIDMTEESFGHSKNNTFQDRKST